MSYVEKDFEYKGFECAVLFQPLGFRTAYVNVGQTNLKGKCYDDIDIYCHGGLTYSNQHLNGHETNDNDWWIGWDYGHCDDGYDFESAKRYYADSTRLKEIELSEKIHNQFGVENGYIHTLEDCIQECKNVVDQVIELTKG